VASDEEDAMKVCEAEGCDRERQVFNHGRTGRYCMAHQQRWYTYGDLFLDVPIGYKPGRPLPEVRAELAIARTTG
jgi:hypothetical protein